MKREERMNETEIITAFFEGCCWRNELVGGKMLESFLLFFRAFSNIFLATAVAR